MLIHRDHPTGSKWTCGECAKQIASGTSCTDCHNILCDDCAGRTHRVPAGTDAGKPCLVIAEPAVALVA